MRQRPTNKVPTAQATCAICGHGIEPTFRVGHAYDGGNDWAHDPGVPLEVLERMSPRESNALVATLPNNFDHVATPADNRTVREDHVGWMANEYKGRTKHRALGQQFD